MYRWEEQYLDIRLNLAGPPILDADLLHEADLLLDVSLPLLDVDLPLDVGHPLNVVGQEQDIERRLGADVIVIDVAGADNATPTTAGAYRTRYR